MEQFTDTVSVDLSIRTRKRPLEVDRSWVSAHIDVCTWHATTSLPHVSVSVLTGHCGWAQGSYGHLALRGVTKRRPPASQSVIAAVLAVMSSLSLATCQLSNSTVSLLY